jgi:hypothetical protein
VFSSLASGVAYYESNLNVLGLSVVGLNYLGLAQDVTTTFVIKYPYLKNELKKFVSSSGNICQSRKPY